MLQQTLGAGAPFAAGLVALIPAVLRWWWGRPLARLADDPLIAERLLAHNTRVGSTAGTCLAIALVGWPLYAIWTIPLQFLAQSAAAYPLRKVIYQESWSLAAFLGFHLRLVAGIFGFWGLLAATPAIAALAGRFDWLVAACLAAVLVGWNNYYSDLLRAILRARPVTDRALLDRFDALVTACAIPAPRFDYVPMQGGVLANALALPSRRRSGVLFTDTLLSRLRPDETVAICAHELAHLEYYNPRRVARLAAITWLLIGAAAATAPVARLAFEAVPLSYPLLVWPVAVFLAMALQAKHRQRNETASDVRAVALTGDPDALADALTTLHAIARVPRRWDQQREQHATHPSLARRIRDIRAAVGGAGASLQAAATFRSAAGEAVVTFEDAHLRWHETSGTTHLLDYGSLAELRLHASASGAVSLVAVQRDARRWTMSPQPHDASALQSVLDMVDGRLTHVAAGPAVGSGVARLVAVTGWLIAALMGQFALALIALLASLAPAAALLNAAGCGALVAAAAVLRDGAAGDSRSGMASLLIVLGLCFLVLGQVRKLDAPRATSPLIAVLAACAAIAVAALSLGGLDPIRLHQAARALPAAGVLLVALATACWTWRSRARFRYAALAAALTGASTVTVGSTAFLDRAGTDPLLISAEYITSAPIAAGAETASFLLPFEVDSVRLSPRGRLAAFVRTESDDPRTPSAPPSFHVRRSDTSVVTLDAADLTFVDDRRALLLVLGEGEAEVKEVALDGPVAVTWRVRVPDVRSGSLAYHAGARRWVLVGRDGNGRIIRAAGVVGRTDVTTTSWQNPAGRGGWIETIGTQGDTALIVEKQYSFGVFGSMVPLGMSMGLTRTYAELRLWRVAGSTRVDAGRSLLDAGCSTGALADDGVLCTAFDGTRSRILAIEPRTGSVEALGMLEGQLHPGLAAARGWLAGWSGGGPVAIQLATRQAFRPPRLSDEYVTMLAPSDAVIGTVAPVDGGSRVRLYPLCARVGTTCGG